MRLYEGLSGKFGSVLRFLAERLGFTHKGGQGSHRAFRRSDEPDLLNFQNRGGAIPPYQARQLIRMMDKYGGENDEVSD